MTILLKHNESKKITYTNSGVQEEIIFDIDKGYPLNGSVSCIGDNVLDEFIIQEKIAEDWIDILYSSDGKIQSVSNIGKSKGLRVNIINNASGNINLEILV